MGKATDAEIKEEIRAIVEFNKRVVKKNGQPLTDDEAKQVLKDLKIDIESPVGKRFFETHTNFTRRKLLKAFKEIV